MSVWNPSGDTSKKLDITRMKLEELTNGSITPGVFHSFSHGSKTKQKQTNKKTKLKGLWAEKFHILGTSPTLVVKSGWDVFIVGYYYANLKKGMWLMKHSSGWECARERWSFQLTHSQAVPRWPSFLSLDYKPSDNFMKAINPSQRKAETHCRVLCYLLTDPRLKISG